MTINEQLRHQMYTRLVEVLGADEAATLMEHLPPVGWADVATKRDLDTLERTLRSEMKAGFGELRGEIGELRGEIGVLRGDFQSQLRTTMVAATTVNATVVGIAAAFGNLF